MQFPVNDFKHYCKSYLISRANKIRHKISNNIARNIKYKIAIIAHTHTHIRLHMFIPMDE